MYQHVKRRLASLDDIDYEDMLYTRGYVRKDEIPCLDECDNSIYHMVKAFYETGDVDELASHLKILASEFEIEVPDTAPKVYTKK